MNQIDLQEFGRLTAKVEMLESQMSALQADVKVLIGMLERTKGGWQVLVIAGAIAGAVGGGLVKGLTWWLKTSA